ncbi:hypothetical protein Sjap_011630 [Stephania japonica]|uniref:RNase III domain-containing protein n=1 Tax=Stephania japonica TaxID=461633 RepID=A0AAP0JBW3_9MAGN
MHAMAAQGFAPLRVKASWDIRPRTPGVTPSPNLTFKKKPPKKAALPPSTQTSQTPLPPQTTITTTTRDLDDSYLGYERWLPVPPKVEKPRSIFNAASLAYIGDCIFELYARRHFLFPPLSIDEYNDRVMAVVRCEAQDALLKQLLDEDYLSEEERDILRWGRNIDSGKTRSKKRAGVAVYNRASSLETLVAYLYLTNVKRLEEIMVKLGFSTGASTKEILNERPKNREDTDEAFDDAAFAFVLEEKLP